MALAVTGQGRGGAGRGGAVAEVGGKGCRVSVHIRADNEPSRSLKFYEEGPYYTRAFSLKAATTIA